jgi:arylsulfatase A-like enzyme
VRQLAFILILVPVIGLGALAYSKEHNPAGEAHGPSRVAPPDKRGSGERPNIILVEADDQSVSQFQRQVMPHTFRELVDSGTTFSQMVATPPLCCPSRAATLTGSYPHNSGVMDNGRRAYPKLVDKGNILPVWLQRAGYETGLVGKFLDGYIQRGGLDPAPGWDRWFMLKKPLSYWGPTILDQDTVRRYGSGKYLTRLLNTEAARFVRDNASGPDPFFLWYTPWAPHKGEGRRADRRAPVCRKDGKPLPLPSEHARFKDAEVPDVSTPSFNEDDVSDKPRPFSSLPPLSPKKVETIKDRWRCGAAALATVDQGVGKLIRVLRRTGELGNTMIVYTSDNGAIFGQHRIPRGKIRPTDESARVPTVIRPAATQIEPREAVSDAPVGTVDVAPTILDAAGATPCNGSKCRRIDGTSMWPLLSDPDASSWDSRRGLLLELDHTNCSYAAIRTTTQTFVDYRKPIRRVKPPLTCPGAGTSEYYDRSKDRYEMENFGVVRNPGTAVTGAIAGENLKRRLKRLEACSGHPGTAAAKPCE